MAAINADGAVVTWGFTVNGGNCTSVASELTNVLYIGGTKSAFCALRALSGPAGTNGLLGAQGPEGPRGKEGVGLYAMPWATKFAIIGSNSDEPTPIRIDYSTKIQTDTYLVNLNPLADCEYYYLPKMSTDECKSKMYTISNNSKTFNAYVYISKNTRVKIKASRVKMFIWSYQNDCWTFS